MTMLELFSKVVARLDKKSAEKLSKEIKQMTKKIEFCDMVIPKYIKKIPFTNYDEEIMAKEFMRDEQLTKDKKK